MISLVSFLEIAGAMSEPGDRGTPGEKLSPRIAERVNAIIDAAEWCGWQEDGQGGLIPLWTLRRDIRGHPEGSTVTQATLEAALFGKRKSP